MSDIKGRINSIQSLGAVDGPGVRFTVFFQGCNLRCGCCHNPDTWNMSGGNEITAGEIAEKCVRYREYFGKSGGITLSGGEPLLQPEFAAEIFRLCHGMGINTCLDTSGSVPLTEPVKELLRHTDRVLLDIKYTTDDMYKAYVGCGIDAPLKFLKHLDEQGIPTTLRQVIIPTLNDSEDSVLALAEIAKAHPCVDNAELLPFRKLCRVKYEKMGIPFPFDVYDEPRNRRVEELQDILNNQIT